VSEPHRDAPKPGDRLALPVFPLSTVVLFPGAECPLHIFEPRYRQMARAALEGSRLIGMVTVRPEHVGDMAGDPAVFPIGCMGRIVQAEELPDGRFNIVLHGLGRFRVTDEPKRPPERLYREARVLTLDEPEAEASQVLQLRNDISDLFGRLIAAVAPQRVGEIGPELVADVDDATFVSVLVHVLNLPPVERQSLLETNGVGARLGVLDSILRFQLAGLGLSRGEGHGQVH